jgi:hypothetical protein
MADVLRGTGEPLTAEQRAHVRTPHSPNRESDIDFKVEVEKMNSPPPLLSSFDWKMFEKGSE